MARASSSSTNRRAACRSSRLSGCSRSSGRLRERGVTCIYVSHRMEEIFRLSDAVTVLRDGRHVETRPTSSLDEADAHSADDWPPHRPVLPEARRRSRAVRKCWRSNASPDPPDSGTCRFRVHAGEILGLAGLVGSGRSEVARAIFGIDPRSSGHVLLSGKRIDPSSPRDAIRLGIGLVPEDRKRQGLVLSMTRPGEWRAGRSGSIGAPRVADGRRRDACDCAVRGSAGHARRPAGCAGRPRCPAGISRRSC